MNSEEDNQNIETPSPCNKTSIKKRTPPSAERPNIKRSILEDYQKEGNIAEVKENTLPKDTDDMDVESKTNNDDKKIEDQLQDKNPIEDLTQLDAGTPKVKLTPELLELHRMLNKDWSDKLDQKLDLKLEPLQSSVNEIKANLTTQEDKIEQVMRIKNENIKLNNRCDQMEKENKLLKDHLTTIENHLLENNIILQGINEDTWELNSVLKEKAIHALANTIDADMRQQ